MVATVIYVNNNLQTLLIVIGTVLGACVTTAGSIAVAIIARNQKKQHDAISDVKEQLKTSNGKTVATYVEEIAKQNGDK